MGMQKPLIPALPIAANTASQRIKAMRVRYSALVAVFFLLPACSRNEPATQAELPPEASAQIEAQVIPPPSAQSNAPLQERLVGAVHPQMTELLLRFEQQVGRMPTDFYEFSGRMMDSVPAAPPGMRYQIDPADKAVKLVRKTE